MRQAAFTLIEILLATAAMAILLLALRETFVSAMRVRREIGERLSEWQWRQRVERVLAEDFQNLILTYSSLAPTLRLTKGRSGFTLTSSEVTFYTTSGRVSAETPWPEIQKVHYYITDASRLAQYGYWLTNEAGGVLVRSIIRNVLADVQQESPGEPLCPNVENFEVLLFDGSNWLDEVDIDLETNADQATLPQAVRVRVLFVSRKDEKWVRIPIDLFIPVRVQPIAASGLGSSQSGGSSTPLPGSPGASGSSQGGRGR